MLLDASLRCVCGWRAGFIQVDEGHIYLTRGLAECVGEQGSSKFVWGTLICARVVGGTINNPVRLQAQRPFLGPIQAQFESNHLHHQLNSNHNHNHFHSSRTPEAKARLVQGKGLLCHVPDAKARLAMTAPKVPDSWMDSAAVVKCSLCSAEIGFADALRVNKVRKIYRCKCCNKLATRLQRCSNRPSWKSKEEKERFFNDHNNDSNETLKKHLETLTVETDKESLMKQFAQKSAWLDDADLQKKYKDKPDQLQAVKQNATTMEHPTRKVTLYEDIEFVANNEETTEQGNEKKRQLTTEETVAAHKKAARQMEKAPPGPKAPTDAQKTQMQRALEKADKLEVDLHSGIEQCKGVEVASFIPKPVVDRATRALLELKAAKSQVELALESGWTGNAKVVMTELQDKRKDAIEMIKKLGDLVAIAADMGD